MIPQNPAVDNINKIIGSNRIPHSFMIEGGSIDERLSTALYLAKAVVCEGDLKPCGKCRQCSITDSGSNVDIIFVEPEKDKKFISVDRVRKLRADAYVKPHSAEKKVFIIKNAELMNEQAQNALLKILEEPPESVVFILLTPSRTLQLVTIISRCSVFMLTGDTEGDEALSEQAKELVLLVFDGRFYDALKLLKGYEKDRLKAEKLFRAVQSECVKNIASGNISNFRKKVLSEIYEQLDEYIDLIHNNVNMPLMFSSAVLKFRTFMN